ncbi:MAG: FecR family protein [Bacteroidales bacterium]|nr:FecR family protein [Bacteroidales bacterium]
MKKRDKASLTYDKILLLPDYMNFIQNEQSGIDACGNNKDENTDSWRHELEKAAFLSQILTSHKKIKYSDDIKKQHAGRLLARIKADKKSKQNNNLPLLLRIAAGVLILVALSVALFRREIFMIAGRQGPNMELIVPSGEKSQLILADGTKVWVNSESRLVYPAGFDGQDRKVILEGEAYFDVSKVKNSKFTVYTQDVKVEVLGTKFNVKSYPKDHTIETTVVEGMVRIEDDEDKVRFSPVLLKTDERMIFRKEYTEHQDSEKINEVPEKITEKDVPVKVKEILISQVNTENVTCWKDHLLIFDNETLEEIAIKMSRWYKVDVKIVDDDLKAHRYTGKFVNNETLDQVLEAINLTTAIQYSVNQNSVQIRSEKKKL